MKAAGFNNATKLADEIAAKIRTLSSVKTEPVRAVRRTYSKQLAEAPAPYVIDVATRLLQKHDINRFVAYELLKHHRAAAASVRTSDLEKFGRGLNQWGDVDCFACFLSGPAWREHQISDKVVHRWAHSKDRWWRRVSTSGPSNAPNGERPYRKFDARAKLVPKGSRRSNRRRPTD